MTYYCLSSSFRLLSVSIEGRTVFADFPIIPFCDDFCDFEELKGKDSSVLRGDRIGGKLLRKSAVDMLGRNVEGDSVGLLLGSEPIECLLNVF